MPRFVILEHDHPELHWDFMLEAGDTLRTWKLAECLQPHRGVRAELLPDHRRDYLDYEGPVSGNRGRVRRWDFGSFNWIVNQADAVTVSLEGQRWRGIIQLECGTDGAWWVTGMPGEAGSEMG